MKVSDVIEQFIIELLGDEVSADINRNELASYFFFSPSHINYVLHTRFTVDRGYQVESQRGGGGYIRIERICADKQPYLYALLDSTKEPMSYTRVQQLAENLVSQEFMSGQEADILLASTSDKALVAPANLADTLRSNIIRETVLRLLKR